MENNLFEEDILKLPKYFTDLKGESQGRTPHGGWYQNELLPWIQDQDLKKLAGYGIGMFLLAGKLARILTGFV